MSDYLFLIICQACGNNEYFDPQNPPGCAEHCPFCSECSALLPSPTTSTTAIVDKYPSLLANAKTIDLMVKSAAGFAGLGYWQISTTRMMEQETK